MMPPTTIQLKDAPVPTSRSRLYKRLFLVTAGSLILAVTLWSAYLFIGIWLHTRCARQITALARPLPVIRLSERPQGVRVSYDHGRTWHSQNESLEYETDEGDCSFVSAWSGDSDSLWSRLDGLQRPTVRKLWQELFRPAPTAPQSLASAPASDEDRRMQLVNFQLGMWNAPSHIRYTCIVDAAGFNVWVVVKPVQGEPTATDPQAACSKSFELFLLDEGGHVLARAESPGGYLVGKLPDRLGKADQLVFGTPGVMVADAAFDPSQPRQWLEESERYPGRLVVCVVENAELKIVRDIEDFGIPCARRVPAGIRETNRNDP